MCNTCLRCNARYPDTGQRGCRPEPVLPCSRAVPLDGSRTGRKAAATGRFPCPRGRVREVSHPRRRPPIYRNQNVREKDYPIFSCDKEENENLSHFRNGNLKTIKIWNYEHLEDGNYASIT